jgi:hypothetical protein
MARVPDEARGQGQKQLRPADFGNADVLVGTIETVAFKKDQYRASGLHLTFEEFPGVELRKGPQATSRLVEKFGDDTDDWVGEKIPLVRTTESVGGKDNTVYQIPPIAEWPKLLADAKRAGKRR